MPKILILSDIHIRPAGKTIIGIDTLKRAKIAFDHARTTHPDLDLAILLGDLAHSGRAEEYKRLADLVGDLKIPVLPMLGNHDNRDAFHAQFPDAPATAEGHVQAARDIGDWRILTLDTLDGPPYRNDYHAGFLCPDRLAWLEARLSEAPNLKTLVLTHHPPMPIGFPGIDSIRWANGDALMTVLHRYTQVRHLCSGHVHRTISGSYAGIGFTILKSTAHQMPMDLSGTSTLSSTAEPGAYGLALLTDHVTIHTEDFEIAETGIEARDAHPD